MNFSVNTDSTIRFDHCTFAPAMYVMKYTTTVVQIEFDSIYLLLAVSLYLCLNWLMIDTNTCT